MDITRKLKKGVKEGQLRISKMRGELLQEEEAFLLGQDGDAAAAFKSGGKNKENSSNSSLSSVQDNWLTAVVTCGSNAWGQTNCDNAFELMSSSLKLFTDLPQCEVHAVCCGHSITASVLTEAMNSRSGTVFQSSSGKSSSSLSSERSTLCYLWGNALPGASSAPHKVPYPLKIRHVRFVSCGQAHAALITADARLHTWGSGDNGMLGHGNKIAIPAPKLVEAMSHLLCLSASCGAFHTALVACEQGGVTYLKVPRAGLGPSSPILSSSRDESITSKYREEEEFLECGQLYTCGLNKAGQLGLGDEKNFVATPTWVSSLHSKGFKVAKVSCGFHHTMIIATPVHAVRVFVTNVFACGWGEHGRLGTGDEEGRSLPAQVGFPAPFHPLDISAGEQHSLACGRAGCYAWGNNSMGQLGIGNPSITEFSCEPVKVPLPEGMLIKKIAAGGRHSAGITHCNRLLTWGWGEEGQLGHGSEKSAYLPRPCRIPKVRGKQAVPIDISLGMCHTAVVVRNALYIEPFVPRVSSPVKTPMPTSPIVVREEPKPVIIEPEEVVIEPVVDEQEEIVVESPPREPSPEPESPPSPEPVPIVRSIKELLQQREERMISRTAESPPKLPSPKAIIVEEPAAVEIPAPVPEVVEIKCIIQGEEKKEEPEEVIAEAPKVVEDRYKIFYMDGQNTDNCLVANSAKRAEARRKRREEESLKQKKDGNTTKSTNIKIYI